MIQSGHSFDFYVVGLSHKSATIPILERFSVKDEKYTEFIKNLKLFPMVKECAILSTCNRFEVYLCTESKMPIVEIKSFLLDQFKMSENISTNLYHYQNREAVKHMLMVASSLDSSIVGETQILGQIKDAYAKAHEHGGTGVVLNTLFHKVFSVAKRVRTETNIGSTSLSVSTAAVRFVKEKLDRFDDRSVLLLGAGEMAQSILKSFSVKGVKKAIIINRTEEKASELASLHDWQVRKYYELKQTLSEIDIFICSIASQQWIIRHEDISTILKNRSSPLFIFDLGVPRNIDPEIQLIENVFLYNLDDLKTISDKNKEILQVEIQKAIEMIDHETDKIIDRFSSFDTKPVVQLFVNRAEEIFNLEWEAISHKLKPEENDRASIIYRFAYSLKSKLVNESLGFIKNKDFVEIKPWGINIDSEDQKKKFTESNENKSIFTKPQNSKTQTGYRLTVIK